MTAPSIPNLNSLRGGRGRGRGRGLGSLVGSAGQGHEEENTKHDKIIQQTDQDASLSRLSAVQAGYLDDPYAKLFATCEVQKRLPIINRGTYVRTKVIDGLIDNFIASNPSQRKQIISLGAGTDTRYFRMMSRYDTLDEPNWSYHEIDFWQNAARKVQPIIKHTELATGVRNPTEYAGYPAPTDKPECIIDGPYFHVHPVDLRTLDSSREPPPTFRSIDTSLPTLILSECCLCYLAPTAADTVAMYFTKHLFPSSTPLGMIVYEPIKPDDAFGKTMVSNLAARGIVLQTLKKYGSLEAQAARMQFYGLTNSRGANINELWKIAIPLAEKERVASLEMLDEVEEWELLAAHYCVVWGWRDGKGGYGTGYWDQWKTLFD